MRQAQSGMPSVEVKFDQFPLRGGLDLETPQLSVKPGVARDALNYECAVTGGYARVSGYERVDGRPSPSLASYGTLACTALTGIAVGDSVNGQTSGATAVVAYITGTTAIVTKRTGTFIAAENLRKGVSVAGVISTVDAAPPDASSAATYALAAANIYRADIAAVPGSGNVLGVFSFNGTVYAFRNNAGNTAAIMHKSGSSGWTAVPMPYELAFTAGSGTAPAEGATVSKAGVSAVVRRVMVQSGTFAGSNAVGRLIIDAPTGGSFSAGAFTAGITATCSGVQTQVSFAVPSGRFDFDIGNAGLGVRVYGCDGKNRAFEFDGSYVCPITTGNTVDTPLHVKVHKKYLWLSFGASAQYSGIATPYSWAILAGAGEIALNQALTGFVTLPGDANTAALAMCSDSAISILYGTSSANWNLVEMNAGMGSKPYAMQAMTQSYLYDTVGLVSLAAVQEFGNFKTSTLTLHLSEFVNARQNRVTASMVDRNKSLYRVFFDDGYGLACTIVNGAFLGAFPILYTNPVTCAFSGNGAESGQKSYFGSTNGMVYQNDIGTSFDGGVIDHYCDLAFAAQGNSRLSKRYRMASFELQASDYAEFNMGYTLAYASAEASQATTPQLVQTATSPSYWDAFTWDEFVWDGRKLAPARIPLEGTAENIAIRMEGSSAKWPAHTVNSITLHYTPRRIIRGQ